MQQPEISIHPLIGRLRYTDAIISAGMAKNIIRENDYEKDTYRSYSHNYFLYGSCIIYLREI